MKCPHCGTKVTPPVSEDDAGRDNEIARLRVAMRKLRDYPTSISYTGKRMFAATVASMREYARGVLDAKAQPIACAECSYRESHLTDVRREYSRCRDDLRRTSEQLIESDESRRRFKRFLTKIVNEPLHDIADPGAWLKQIADEALKGAP